MSKLPQPHPIKQSPKHCGNVPGALLVRDSVRAALACVREAEADAEDSGLKMVLASQAALLVRAAQGQAVAPGDLLRLARAVVMRVRGEATEAAA